MNDKHEEEDRLTGGDLPQDSLDRREFLKATAGAVLAQELLFGCAPPSGKLPAVGEEQRRFKLKGPSTVALVKCASYSDLSVGLLREHLKELSLPPVNGKSVLLKINMVDYRPYRPLTTDIAVIRTAVEMLKQLGAKQIIVGDASALNRDTEFLLDATGIGRVCKELDVPFVDLNIDDIDKVENAVGLTPEKFFALPRTAVRSDLLISMPKLKTHRWALVTAALKNLFGVVPGRAYGWPKNFLHVNGIDPSVIDIAVAVKAGFAIVDAVVSMEGHGPLDGTALNTGFIVTGSDLTAVDAVCCRAMKIDPDNVPYLKLAQQSLGNTSMSDINLLGDSIESVAREFKLPRTYKRVSESKIVSSFEESSSQAGAT